MRKNTEDNENLLFDFVLPGSCSFDMGFEMKDKSLSR
jgi:hypothetical protein